MLKLLVAISTVADGSMYDRTDPENQSVIANRTSYLKTLGISMDQTTRVNTKYESADYCRYREATGDDKGSGMRNNNVAIADGVVTTSKDHALLLPVADCVGAVIFDPIQNILMVSHLGRHSLEQQGGVRSVAYLVDNYGSKPETLQVWLTPAPNKEIYPIWALENKGMKEVTFEQLKKAGILDENIIDNPADSATDESYYSYSEYLKGHRQEDGDHVIVAMMTD